MASQTHPKGGRIFSRGRKWYAACYVGGVEKVRRGGTKKEASAVLSQLQRERDEGIGYIPLSAVLDLYGRNVAARRKVNTVRSFREGEKILLDEFGASYNVFDLTKERINDLLESRHKGQGLAPITANKPAKTLRAALRYAVPDLLKEVPLKVPTLQEVQRKPRILTVKQFKKLRNSCVHPAARLAIVLAYQTGLRHDEIVSGLRIRDFGGTAEGDIYTIDVRAHGSWTPKAHAERSIPMPESAIHEVAIYLANEHPFYHEPDAPLVCWGVSAPRRYRDLYEPVRAAFQAAGLHNKANKSGLHQCRRTFASHLLTGGADLKTVMELGGWSTIEAVQRYLASTDELKVGAMSLLDVE